MLAFDEVIDNHSSHIYEDKRFYEKSTLQAQQENCSCADRGLQFGILTSMTY